MPVSPQLLADLLSPSDYDEFFRDHWERQSLHIVHDNPHRFRDLLSRRDLDQILACTRPRFADPGAFHDAPPAPATYIRGVLAGQPTSLPFDPGLADLRDAYDRGKSLVVMSMQHRWPPLGELCRGLEALFHCPVHANLYLTPAGSQGFAAHYDPHEVFALQLDGVKHWRLYDRVEPFPMADTVRMPEGSLGKPREVCLGPGDVLYIPRGHVHDAYTRDHPSLHVTVGVNIYRWADLLHNAVVCATRDNIRLRESIPGGALPGDGAALKLHFRDLLAALAEGPHLDQLFEQALESLGTQFFSELKMLPGNQFSAPEADGISIETILERSPLMVCRVVENEQGVAIEFPGNRVKGPRRIASALRFVANASRFAVHDLPDELNADSKLALIRRLVHEGLLTLAGAATGSTAPQHCVRVRSGGQNALTDPGFALTDPGFNDDDADCMASPGLQPAIVAPR